MTSYPSLIPELLSIRPYLHYQLELIFITVRLFRQTYRNLSELVDDSTSLPPRQLSMPALHISLPRQFPRQSSTS